MMRFHPYRYEIKYLVTSQQLRAFEERAKGLLVPDEHNAGNMGYHNYSIYFDGPGFRYYTEKREGLSERTKPRLRTYRSAVNGETSAAFFELKHRQGRMVSKSRVQIPLDLARTVLGICGPDATAHEDLLAFPILRWFRYLVQRDRLAPSLCVFYHRYAYRCRFGRNLRVTYDMGLQSSLKVSLDAALSSFTYMLPPNQMLIEVKFRDRIPMWLARTIEQLQLEEISLSKYAQAVEHCYSPLGMSAF